MSLTLLLGIIALVIIMSAITLYKRYKWISVGLFSIPILLLLILVGWSIYEENYHFVKSTDLSDEFLGDIYLNDSVDNYKKLNSEIEFSKGDNVYYPILLQSSSLFIGATNNDEIVFINSSISDHETSKKS